MELKDWIPLLQSLVWPIFLGLFLIAVRVQVRELLHAIQERVARGASLQVGPSGLTLGQSDAPKIEPASAAATEAEEPEVIPHSEDGDIYYVVHTAEKSHSDRSGREWYRVAIYLDADDESSLDKVKKVVYHLHPSFPQPDVTVTNRKDMFEYQTVAWGQFMLTADVYLKTQDKPLTLYRYINL